MFDVIGNVKPPSFMTGQYSSFQTGITAFISNLVKLITVIAGIFVLINLLLAGLQYISSQGDPKGVEGAWNKIWMSLVGLVIIVAAFVITAIISYILFGDASFILNPKVYGPGV
jgi:hypothetical protein